MVTVLGAVVFIFFQDELMSFTEYWRLTFGVLLVKIVIFFPNGPLGLGLASTLRYSTVFASSICMALFL